jgi:uncharacterized protein (DUF1697 family)
LIRGINVGRAQRVAMSDLRVLVEELGHTNVRTLLNSGNVLFHAQRPNTVKLSAQIEAAIAGACGFSAAVTIITAKDLSRIIDENPLLHLANDPCRHLVAFAAQPQDLISLRPLLKEAWTPDAFAIGSRAAYLWCFEGLLDGKLIRAFSRIAAGAVTTRNWATVLKLQAAAKAAS